MGALQIRNVPDAVRDTLAERAASRGQSLQAYLLALVNADADRPSNADILRQISARGGSSRTEPDEAAKLIEEVRAERDAHLR